MAIGTTTALIAGLSAASAGAQLYSAKKGADASREAAKIQQNSANQALAEARNAYNQQMSFQMPYMNAGASAINTLSRLMAPPAGAQFAAPMPTPVSSGMGMPPGGGYQPMQAVNPFMIQPSATQMRMGGRGQMPMAAQSPLMVR